MDSPTLQADRVSDETNAQEQPNWVDTLIDLLGAASRHIALLAAWVATGGSLFFSEVLHWQPCVLCWYQRILMYPLAILLAIGIARRERGLHVYVLPFSVAGMSVSLYHYLLIKTDWLPPPPCAVGVPCTVDYLNWLGFINIPFLALSAFLIITCMMLTFAWLQPLDAADDASDVPPAAGFDPANLAVVMIIVSVILAYLLGSTFI